MKSFKILSSEMISDVPYCRIEKQRVILPNKTETDWYIKHSEPAVVIIPVLKSGEILLQRTYKHGCGKVVVEFPAGLVDNKEAPAFTAERELREETGYVAEDIIPLGRCCADATGSKMTYYFFLAQGCEKLTEPTLDDSEQIQSFTVASFADVTHEFLAGEYETSSSSLAALAAALKG